MKARIPNAGGQNRGDMMKMIQQAQADMQNAQAEVEATEYTASVGGGAVEAVVNGAHEVKAINISPDVVDPEDVEMLEDMLMAALNEAMRKIDDDEETELAAVTGGLNIPGL